MELGYYFILLTILIFLFLNSTRSKKFVKIKIKGTVLKVEVADTSLKRMKGLMFRKSLPRNSGMLFVFNSKNYHTIWTVNMRFPIDIIWLDEKMRVVDMVEDAQPCRISYKVYKPRKKAKYILEVNSGVCKKHGIKLGSVFML